MQFKLLSAVTLHLQPQLQWLLHSDQTKSFLTGDDRKSFALPISNPNTPSPLTPARPYDNQIPPKHPCNLPIPASLYQELATQNWHGFQFLDSSAYDAVPDGDLLRTLTFGPNYGHYLLHPASGLILSLRAGSMELLQQSPNGFKSIEKTRTRGKAALTFAAHPTETLLAYGDNNGTFHAHRFIPTGFGKATKIATKERNATRVEFVKNGERLLLGGMGYLSAYAYDGNKFTPLHDTPIAVRDFLWTNDGNLILVNQGLHGIAAYRYDQTGFTKIGDVKPPSAVHQIAISKDARFLAASIQDSAAISIFKLSTS